MKDIRIGARMLAKTPLFTLFAVSVLAVTIGANITVFSFAKAVLWRSLSVPRPDLFVRLYAFHSDSSFEQTTIGEFWQYRDRAQSFENIAAYSWGSGWHPLLRIDGRVSAPVDLMRPVLITDNFFETIGMRMTLGRPITPEDARPGAPYVAVLSDEGWKRYFARDPQVLGRTIFLNNDAYTIIGVAPPAFTDVFHATLDDLDLSSFSSNAPNGARLFVPWYRPQKEELVRLIGRLKPSTTRSSAQADISRIAAQLSTETRRPISVRVMSGDALEPTKWTVLAAVAALFVATVAIVLMIACDNIAILLLARIAARRREIGIRLALGATRGQLVRQLISENLILSLLGGVGALIVALVTARIIEGLPLPLPLPNAFSLTFDWRVIVFATLISLATTVLFGMRPALQAVTRDVVVSLNPGALPGEAAHSTVRSTLVITQVTVCTALLITAIVLVRSQRAPAPLDRGFSPRQVVLANLNFDERPAILEFYEKLLPRLEQSPEIVSASVAQIGPIPGQIDAGGAGAIGPLRVHGDTGNQEFQVETNNIMPGYFRTIGVSLVDGRDFNSRDRIGTRPVGIINETLARQLSQDGNPVGRFLRLADGSSIEVIGVAHNFKYSADEKVEAFLYRPLAQQRNIHRNILLVRGTQNAAVTASILRATIAEVDPNLFVHTRTMEQDIRFTFLPNVVAMYIAGAPGVLALILSMIGIYGTMALVVTQRRREIGIRVALGAHPSQAVALMLKQGMKWTAIGLGMGAFGALVLTSALSRYFYGVPHFDSLSFGLTIVLLGAISAVACYIPARTASRLDPMAVLGTD
jgi:predicted permease